MPGHVEGCTHSVRSEHLRLMRPCKFVLSSLVRPAVGCTRLGGTVQGSSTAWRRHGMQKFCKQVGQLHACLLKPMPVCTLPSPQPAALYWTSAEGKWSLMTILGRRFRGSLD